MPHFGFSFAVGALVLGSVASTACTNHTVVHVRAPERVVLESKCIDTECDAGRREQAGSKACKDCIGVSVDICDYDPACPSTEELCRLECATEKCYAPSPCIESSWTAHLENFVATPGIAEACQAANAAAATRCGYPPSDIATAWVEAECAQAALANTEAGAAYLGCLGTSACGEVADCDRPSSFGADLCAMPTGGCLSGCQDPGHGRLDGLGSRLKPALLDAARQCMNETSCDDVIGCMAAWQKLVGP
jgi:hypothetical protein